MKRSFLILGVIAVLGAALYLRFGKPVGTPVRVQLEQGLVEGRMRAGSLEFLGIPYAEAPVGRLRLDDPRPKQAWAPAVLDAKTMKPTCVELEPYKPGGTLSSKGQEDCLYLNVHVPGDHLQAAKALPVMVWVHGGAGTRGGPSVYDGELFARESGVIVVSFSYRMGVLASLTYGSIGGNFAFKDQVMAMKWVKRNIEKFGGDPENITAFGQSFGALSLCTLLASPWAEGLFQKAIIQSGNCGAASPEDAHRDSRLMIKALGCEGEDAEKTVECLRSLPETDFREKIRALDWDIEFFSRHIVNAHVDGDFLPDQPLNAFRQGKSQRAEIIFTLNRHEASSLIDFLISQQSSGQKEPNRVASLTRLFPNLFMQEDAPAMAPLLEYYARPGQSLGALIDDVIFRCPLIRTIDALQSNGTAVRFFEFKSPLWFGLFDLDFHAQENLWLWRMGWFDWERDGASYFKEWTDFAKKTASLPGRPNGPYKVPSPMRVQKTNFRIEGVLSRETETLPEGCHLLERVLNRKDGPAAAAGWDQGLAL